MSHFKIKSKKKLSEMNVGDTLPESDFCTLTEDGLFVQLEYVEEDEEPKPYVVKPGIFAITADRSGLYLEPAGFTKDKILDEFVHTKTITERIDKFFSKLHVYYEHGIEVPKRGILLYGPAGSGKSTSISKVSETYVKDGKTLIIVWTTDKYESHDVKTFIKSFKYEGVEKLILIAEDIGGVEISEVKMKSDPSLLSLLDNQGRTFTIPTLILATTNFPEIFLGNLTNRPNRFDDKIEVGYPSPEYRLAILKFFNKNECSKEEEDAIKANRCSEFTPAHIREVILRSAIFDKTIVETIKEMTEEIELFKKAFSKRKSTGFGLND
jgi:SpoVK/Ycf46/Vps4 family AAA+-type ATPase